MQRVNAPGATVNNMFTNGDPALSIPATDLEQTWHNDVQEELCNAIEGLGVSLNGAQRNQLLTALSANYAKIPVGTKMVFYQASAPSGWTMITTQNDKALRVVSASGGGAGGTHPLSTPPSTSHTHTGPSHTHDMSMHYHAGPSHTHAYSDVIAHSHSFFTDVSGAHVHGVTDAASSSTGANGRVLSGNVGSTTLSYAMNGAGDHQHSGVTNTAGFASATTAASGTGATGTPSSNNTGASGTGNTGSSGPTAFAPQYIDVIICTRN